MRTVLMIHGGKVTEAVPSNRFAQRLNWAIDYYQQHHATEDVVFLITGRYSSATANYPLTEAEVGKRCILEQLPHARVVKEDVSLETIGNYAFSKPIILGLKADKIILLTSEVMKTRVEFIAKKVFADAFDYTFHLIKDELSTDQSLKDREADALTMAKRILDQVPDGNDAAARDMLLYHTPYYFKGIINDRAFFEKYWPRGYADFTAKRSIRQSKG